MQTKSYIWFKKLDKLNIFYRLNVIGCKTEMSRSVAWRGASRRGAVRRGAAWDIIIYFDFSIFLLYFMKRILNKTKLSPIFNFAILPSKKRHNILVSKSLQCCSSNTWCDSKMKFWHIITVRVIIIPVLFQHS